MQQAFLWPIGFANIRVMLRIRLRSHHWHNAAMKSVDVLIALRG
jgi:hypothetical protein